MLCESCICEEDPRERGTGGNEGECLGIHGFSSSNHPSCSRRLFLVIEHHEYCCRMSCSLDMDFLLSSGACVLPIQFVRNLESRRTRLPATARDCPRLPATARDPSRSHVLGANSIESISWRWYSCCLSHPVSILNSNIYRRILSLLVNRHANQPLVLAPDV
jgi:hypothetical protein